MTAVVSLGGDGVHLPVGKHVAETPDEVAMIPITPLPACTEDGHRGRHVGWGDVSIPGFQGPVPSEGAGGKPKEEPLGSFLLFSVNTLYLWLEEN